MMRTMEDIELGGPLPEWKRNEFLEGLLEGPKALISNANTALTDLGNISEMANASTSDGACASSSRLTKSGPLKPIEATPMKKWEENSKEYRSEMEDRVDECMHLRNNSRRLRYEAELTKSWDLYYNNIKLENRIYEIKNLILYAETMLPQIQNEKMLVNEEKFLTEQLLVNCDTWIEVCMNSMNILDCKLAKENTRDDQVIIQTKKEVELLEEVKRELKDKCLTAWNIASRLEMIETKIDLNLEFKKEVLATDEKCLAINKMDTGISYKVDALKGPKKMLTIEEWTKEVYGLVKQGQDEIRASTKLREEMSDARGNALTKYKIQFETTDFELRKRIYQINREKNECQYQIKRVSELMMQTKGELERLELFYKQLTDDLKCAETRCAFRFFRPEVDATMDPPFHGINEEVAHLRERVQETEKQLFALRDFYNRMEADRYRLGNEEASKNKSLQVELQALDVRLAGRYDPKKVYAYSTDVLASKMVKQLPPPFIQHSNKLN